MYWFATPNPGSTATFHARSVPTIPTDYLTITMANVNVTVGSTQAISTFSTFPSNSFLMNSGSALITEYGAVGQFVAGTYTATKTDIGTGQQHTYTGSFRVRRTN